MKRIAAGITALVLFAADVCAMDWPAPSLSLVRNFGWNDSGKPVTGAVFEGTGPVLAAEKGELIFSHRTGNTASRLPSSLGAWAALDHGDGLISIYSRYEDDQNAGIPVLAERNDPVAAAGISGWSQRSGVYFALYDRRERRWVNPSMIITPFPDTRPPVIQSVSLKSADGRTIDPSRMRNIAQGRYAISIITQDTMTSAADSPLAPHRIVCSVNGAEIGALSFETLSSRDGVLMAYRNGLVPAKQVYAPYPGFEVGEVWFNRGQATLELIVQDIAGNSRSALFRLIIE
ncbi:MAG: hypothetical protein LBN21_09885 [Treponema sp.]|nr:hypothetical protein [Treponema sp.]